MRNVRIIPVLLVSLLATACASSGSSGLTEKRSPLRQDADYIAAVEAAAKQRGVVVQWVNPPYRSSQRDTPR